MFPLVLMMEKRLSLLSAVTLESRPRSPDCLGLVSVFLFPRPHFSISGSRPPRLPLSISSLPAPRWLFL